MRIFKCEDCGIEEEITSTTVLIGRCEVCKGVMTPLKSKPEPVVKLQCSGGLVAMQAEAKLFIDANVWDGEDRSGAMTDRATFNPDELQELIDDLLEHMSN